MPIIQNASGQTTVLFGAGDISMGHIIAADAATGQPNMAHSSLCLMQGQGLSAHLPPDGTGRVAEWPVAPTLIFKFNTPEALETFVAGVNSMLLHYQRTVIDSIQDAVVLVEQAA